MFLTRENAGSTFEPDMFDAIELLQQALRILDALGCAPVAGARLQEVIDVLGDVRAPST